MGKSFSKLFRGGGEGGGGAAGKKGLISEHDRAVLDLKVARDRLKRYAKKMDGEAQQLTKQAGVLVKDGRSDRALILLKIKRYKAEQVTRADAQLFTVTELLETVEWEGQQAQVLAAMAEGTAALNKLHEEMPIEEVEQLMADTQEAIEYEGQISAAIAGAWTPDDEADLLKEFEALQQEVAASEGETAAAAAPAAKKAKMTKESTAAASSVVATAQGSEQAQQSVPATASQAALSAAPAAPTAAVVDSGDNDAAAHVTAAADSLEQASAALVAPDATAVQAGAASATAATTSAAVTDSDESTAAANPPSADDIASQLPEAPTGSVVSLDDLPEAPSDHAAAQGGAANASGDEAERAEPVAA